VISGEKEQEDRVMKEKIERTTRDHRWITISGLLFVAAWVVGLLVASPPVATAPITHVIAYYEANREMVQSKIHEGELPL
jgi:hypothetical protein